MDSSRFSALYAAVAQLTGAQKVITKNLRDALDDATFAYATINNACLHITDQATLDRLDYEQSIISEDMSTLIDARQVWAQISGKVDDLIPSLQALIDNAACDALSYDDFVANKAKEAEIDRINLQRRRDNIRPMTQEEMDRLVREDLSAYARIFLGLPVKGPFRVVDEVVECEFDLHGKSIVVSRLPDGVWKWRGRNSLAGGSIWHLEAAAKQIPSFEALTNIRLHFGTEAMSARAGNLPCIEGLKAHWEQEAYAHAADLRHDNEAIWEKRLAEAEEAGRRVRNEGNPDDLQPIVFTEFGPIHPANLPAGAFGGIFTNRRVL